MAGDRENIVFVEYQDGRPFNVVTENGSGRLSYFDFEWCKRDRTLYFYESGSGGTWPLTLYPVTTFWAKKHATFQVYEGRDARPLRDGEAVGTRLPRPPRGYPLKTLFEQASESGCIYCSTCSDYLPREDTDQPCEHTHWCDEAGWWSTPDERCPAGCVSCLGDDNPTRAERSPFLRAAEGFGMIAPKFREAHSDNPYCYAASNWYGWDYQPELRTIADGAGRAAMRVFNEEAAWN